MTVRDRGYRTMPSAVQLDSVAINSIKLKVDPYRRGLPESRRAAPIPPTEVVSTFDLLRADGDPSRSRARQLRVRRLVGRAGSIRHRLRAPSRSSPSFPAQTADLRADLTVPTDQTADCGRAHPRDPRCDPRRSRIVQATDVSAGAFVRGTFVIMPVTDGNAADLVVLPDAVTITGPDTQTCSSGVRTDLLHLRRPASLHVSRHTFPQFLTLSIRASSPWRAAASRRSPTDAASIR